MWRHVCHLRASSLSLIGLTTLQALLRQCVFVHEPEPYLVILAVSVDHPVLSVGADLKLEGGDMVRILSFL